MINGSEAESRFVYKLGEAVFSSIEEIKRTGVALRGSQQTTLYEFPDSDFNIYITVAVHSKRSTHTEAPKAYPSTGDAQ